MNIDLSGKRAVICGGSRGIGRAIALACAEAGAGGADCARGAGAVLNISSISAFHPSVRTTPYGVAKAAVVQYTQNRAAALAKKGVRVNCICPGSIEFPGGSWERHKANNPQLYNAILRSIPF